jgi:hypothetical protein
MNDAKDRLYALLPAIHRIRDIERGEPLHALLRVIAEQVNLVEEDITQLYENWFIETCEDWVVPYIGDLIGYRQVHEAGEPGEVSTARGQERNKVLIPRRELANTIRYRRRKGTLALLELLANDVAGWPARAVEFFRLLGWTQAINHQHLERGRTLDLRQGEALDRRDGPFDALAHTVDVRRINSHRTVGRYNIPSVGLFVWRLKAYPVTHTPAYCLEEIGPNYYTFSVLGNDAPLYTHAEPETEPTQIAGELNLPLPIRRRAFEARSPVDGVERKHAAAAYYGEEKSVAIWAPDWPRQGAVQPIPHDMIIPADLSNWQQYHPRRNTVAVDPHLGRMTFPPGQLPRQGVWVSYYYGFSADLGGGEYDRVLSQPTASRLYQVGRNMQFTTIKAAYDQWKTDAVTHPVTHAVIEIIDSGVYVEQMNITLEQEQSLQLRAANRQRPVIRLLDWQTDRPDSLTVTGASGSRLTLDGLLITGRGVQVAGDVTELTVRHSTLVPGWTLDSDCAPRRPAEPSLEIANPNVSVKIMHSILGSIQVNPAIQMNQEGQVYGAKAEEEAALARCRGIGQGIRLDPITIHISDSILDATSPEREAIGAPGCPVAHACLTILRSTVFGQLQVHAIALGENCILAGRITVARRQQGCLRFCYVTPGSRTPRRYHCQPDLIATDLTGDAKAQAEARVQPRFNSTRYGVPTYCQLAATCAAEIRRGADNASEMGVFHDLYQPQRAANLRARLDEYTPVGLEAGIIYASQEERHAR